MPTLVVSTSLFLFLVSISPAAKADDLVPCELPDCFVPAPQTSGEQKQLSSKDGAFTFPAIEELPLDEVRSKIAASSRFWGKRSDETKAKLIKSSRFWGKRSSVLPDISQEIPAVPASSFVNGPRVMQRADAIYPKLAISSRFWGRRR